MSRYINRRSIAGLALLLILAIVLPPLINVSRFRLRVADAISRALGQQVTIGEVHLRLFPRPGLDLDRLVVQDDPAYSAEPMLHADQVSATLRLTSLWAGRLEIASLSLSYPSLNLVRAPNGHWNLESLLERARQIPTAPTGKRSAGARPRFPYVEAKGGRINLKLGQEKTVYALSNADFALSLPSENVWQIELAARPVRTDANLSDTGSVRVSGSIQRGSTLTDTPLNLRIVLDRAQLGQLTTVFYGRDRGWRGTVNASATLKGTPAALKVAGDASVDDFRRYDIAMRGAVRLAAHCAGAFSTSTRQLTDIACRAPVGAGMVEAQGEITGILPLQSYTLAVTAKDLPANSLMVLAQRMKKDLPEDLQAGGTVNAAFDLRTNAWEGVVSTSRLRFDSKLIKAPMELGEVHFLLGTPPPARGKRTTPVPAATLLRMSDLSLDLGGASPAKVQAWFGHDAYNIDVLGEARADRLLEVAHALGVRAPQATITGMATADIHVAGNWSGFAAPIVTGNLHLRELKAAIPGIAAPLQVTTAALHLTPEAAAIYDLAGSFTGTHLSFTGSVQVPRLCPTNPCPIAFQLKADQLSTDELNRLLNPRAQKRPWYAFIGGNPSQPVVLAKLSAVGKVSAARIDVKTMAVKKASADVRLDSGVLTVSNLRADVLGGTTAGEFRADFRGAQPEYSIRGTLQQASMAALAAITRDAWATGRANATYRVAASGWDAGQLRTSAKGAISFDWHDGSLSHLALNGAPPPLNIRRFQGELELSGGQLTFKPSKMETSGGIYVVSGSASLDRQLGVRLMRGKTEVYDIGGTVEKPRVTPAVLPATQAAAIKP